MTGSLLHVSRAFSVVVPVHRLTSSSKSLVGAIFSTTTDLVAESTNKPTGRTPLPEGDADSSSPKARTHAGADAYTTATLAGLQARCSALEAGQSVMVENAALRAELSALRAEPPSHHPLPPSGLSVTLTVDAINDQQEAAHGSPLPDAAEAERVARVASDIISLSRVITGGGPDNEARYLNDAAYAFQQLDLLEDKAGLVAFLDATKKEGHMPDTPAEFVQAAKVNYLQAAAIRKGQATTA